MVCSSFTNCSTSCCNFTPWSCFWVLFAEASLYRSISNNSGRQWWYGPMEMNWGTYASGLISCNGFGTLNTETGIPVSSSTSSSRVCRIWITHRSSSKSVLWLEELFCWFVAMTVIFWLKDFDGVSVSNSFSQLIISSSVSYIYIHQCE